MSSIAVETVVANADTTWFQRWLDAVIHALSSGARDGVLSSWRIVVGTTLQDEMFDEESARVFRVNAVAEGGELDFRLLGAPVEAGESFLRRDHSTDIDVDFILVLGADTIILPSTLERLIAANDGGAAAARQLPVQEGEMRCVLLDARIADSGRSARPSDAPIARRAEAVVFTRSIPLAAAGAVDVRELTNAPGVGSLLERALAPGALVLARRTVEESLLDTPDPSLSIVMRTQGRRPEPLRDALLCLAGQSDERFELLLVVHDSDPQVAVRVVDDQPGWLRSRTTVLVASGGTRSRPLNVGIAASTGTHIAFLDDDDLVFSNWVASFLDAAANRARQVIRATAGVQHVATDAWPGGLDGHATVSELDTPYPARFDLADHLRVNMTPFMAFAFPTAFFTVFGGADESLEVCEDWDLVLRAASVLGVVDVPALTAIYRRWQTGSDSYSIHNRTAWDRDMEIVRAKLDAQPLLLPPGAASELAGLSAARGASAQLDATFSSASWRITAPLRAISRRIGKPGSRAAQ